MMKTRRTFLFALVAGTTAYMAGQGSVVPRSMPPTSIQDSYVITFIGRYDEKLLSVMIIRMMYDIDVLIMDAHAIFIPDDSLNTAITWNMY